MIRVLVERGSGAAGSGAVCWRERRTICACGGRRTGETVEVRDGEGLVGARPAGPGGKTLGGGGDATPSGRRGPRS